MLYFLGGFVAGAFITFTIIRIKTTTGAILIDHSNPEKDIYQINLDKFDDLNKKNRVWLRVKHGANLKSYTQE